MTIRKRGHMSDLFAFLAGLILGALIGWYLHARDELKRNNNYYIKE